MNNRTESIAGVLLGKRKDQVVVVNKDTGQTRTINVQGRYLYVKTCLLPERHGAIWTVDAVRDQTAMECWLKAKFALVLAVGSGCGQRERPTKKLRHKKGWMAGINIGDVSPGKTRILFPADAPWGIHDSPIGENEHFVHESHGITIVED